MFQWLLIHKSLPVGVWQCGNLSSPNCVACPNAIESDPSNMGEGEWLPIAIMPCARHNQVGKCMLVIVETQAQHRPHQLKKPIDGSDEDRLARPGSVEEAGEPNPRGVSRPLSS